MCERKIPKKFHDPTVQWKDGQVVWTDELREFVSDIITERKNKIVYGPNKRYAEFVKKYSEDISQEILKQLLETNLYNFDPNQGVPLSAYLRIFIFKRIINIITRKPIAKLDTLEDDSSDRLHLIENPNQPSPEEQYNKKEKINLLKKCYRQLSALQQKAFGYRFFDGLVFREMGERMDCTLQNARTHFRNALGNMKVCVRQNGVM